MCNKTFGSILMLICISSTLQAQTSTLIFENNLRNVHALSSAVGAFGGHLPIDAKEAKINNKSDFLVVAELVFTLNYSLNVGAAGYGTPTRVYYQPSLEFTPKDDLFLEMDHGGFFVELASFVEKLVDLNLPVIIGEGWAAVSNVDYFPNDDDYDSFYLSNESLFFMVEPGVNLELNLARNMRFTLGGSYRFVSGSDMENVSDDDLEALALGTGIRVG